MDYERKYKEAVNKIKNLLDDGEKNGFTIVTYKTDLESIFPELCESEDERIRKRIIHALHGDVLDMEETNKALAWLEKQGERKPTEKVESKFKVGDWILYSGDHYEGVRHITKINENGYYIERNGLPHGIIPFNHEICMRLWTIQDAKDGDVLAASDGSIFIFKEIVDCGCKHYIALEKDNETINVNDNLKHFWEAASGVKPATKKQRDLLYSKMKEVGYEWDAEKKELKIIDWSKQIKYNPNPPSIIEESAWSEEEKVKINRIVACLENLEVADNDILLKDVDWLKSLKERYTWKPSDEQMKVLDEVLNFAANHESSYWNDYIFGTLNNLIRQLKKLKGE